MCLNKDIIVCNMKNGIFKIIMYLFYVIFVLMLVLLVLKLNESRCD